MPEKRYSVSSRGIYSFITANQEPSKEFLESRRGFAADVYLISNSAVFKMTLYNVSDSDQQIVKDIVAELEAEGFIIGE
jgi:hypothetical protein